MAAPIKAVLVAIISAAALFVLTHLAFIFPFYMTVIVETFNLANVAANDNYVKQTYWEESLENMIERPMFEKTWDWKKGDGWNTGNIRITVFYEHDGKDYPARGMDDASRYSWDGDGPSPINGEYKPYCQRGEKVTVTVSAVYPVEITMFAWEVKREVPLSFSITTVGLKYYKDLEYDDLYG